MKLKKGDNVVIVSGKDRGKQGKILRSIPSENKIIVEGVNQVRRRERPKKQGQKGQTIVVAMPLNASNAMIFCSSCGKGRRVGYKITGDKKLRVCRKCGRGV